MSNEKIIDLKRVSKIYNGMSRKFKALDNVNLEIDKGEYIFIIGKSGSGKSTLLHLMSGIDRLDEGEITVNGTDLTKFNENSLSKWRGKNIGIVFQFFQLIPTLTVLENIVLAMDFVNFIPLNMRKNKALELLKLVSLEKHANKFPTALSGGEAQRVAIARALANDPPIIVADEPTGNLDTATSEIAFNIFKELNQNGKTIVIVTHEKDLSNKGDRIITIKDGKIV